jgi:hypothetical protein
MTFIAPLPRIRQAESTEVSKEKVSTTVSHSTEPLEGLNQRYSHVGMPNKPVSSRSTASSNRRRGKLPKIAEFPKVSGAEARDAGPTVTFELDERRFAVGWNITELSQKPAEVIPIRKKL